MAVVGLVSGLLIAFRVDAETVETVSGVIMSAASVVAFVIGEGMADAAGAANESPIIIQTDTNTMEEADTNVGQV